MTNIYLEKVAGQYQALKDYRNTLHNESHEIYHGNWEGHIPARITTKAMEDFRDETYVDENGDVITPDLMDLVRDRMKARYVKAGLEQNYGNDVVHEADRLAHNGASWKGAGAMLVGGLSGAALAARYTRNPVLSAAVGITGMGLGGYFVGKHALDKGEGKADEYLEGVHNRYLQKAAELSTQKKA